MSEVKISAETRTEFGKGAARRLRRADKLPGVVYGHGTDPKHVALPHYDTLMALKNSNVLINLDIDGKSQLVIPKAVQRDALRIGILKHVDLLVVKKGEKVTVDVPIHVEGDLGAGQHLLEHALNALPVEAEATHIPETVTVSVEGLVAGATVYAKDVVLPKGTTLAVDEDDVVIQVLAAQAEEPAAESAEGEESAGGSAGE